MNKINLAKVLFWLGNYINIFNILHVLHFLGFCNTKCMVTWKSNKFFPENYYLIWEFKDNSKLNYSLIDKKFVKI